MQCRSAKLTTDAVAFEVVIETETPEAATLRVRVCAHVAILTSRVQWQSGR